MAATAKLTIALGPEQDAVETVIRLGLQVLHETERNSDVPAVDRRAAREVYNRANTWLGAEFGRSHKPGGRTTPADLVKVAGS